MKRILLIAILPVVVLAALLVWAPALLLNAISRLADAAVLRDVAYSGETRHKLDVYYPRTRSGALPVVVFFYGGSWQYGSKAVYRFLGAALAERGLIVVIPDYRLYPAIVYPEFLRDSARAVRWVKENIGRYGGDPARLFLAGHSAGAYNAAMLTLDRRWLGEAGVNSERDIRGAIGIAGPYDFLPLESEALKVIFGPEAARPLTQPIYYVDGKAPPMLLLRAASDPVVDPGNSVRLAERIKARGGVATVKTYERPGHISIIGTFSPLLRFLAPALEDMTAFVQAHSQRPVITRQ